MYGNELLHCLCQTNPQLVECSVRNKMSIKNIRRLKNNSPVLQKYTKTQNFNIKIHTLPQKHSTDSYRFIEFIIIYHMNNPLNNYSFIRLVYILIYTVCI